MGIDIAFGIFALIGFGYGAKQGAIRSVFAFLAIFIGIILSLKFGHELASYLYLNFEIQSKFLPLISFLLIFVAAIVLVHLLIRLIEGVLKLVFLNFVNRLLGGVLWLLLMVILFSTTLWFLNQVNMLSPELKASSQTYAYIQPAAPILFGFIGQVIPGIQGLFESIEQLFKQLSSEDKEIVALLSKGTVQTIV